ncbi:MAG: YkgJ family cysteine cluster protein [Gammaproteobacteria bacterium]|nr:MAG: YkgJ family cysteine cluster protein [Gammaproteobacteria bacterium]
MSEEKPVLPHESPLVPNLLALDSQIRFRCHKDIACFNACCRNIDIQLTPYDLYRLKQRLGMSSSELLNRYTFPFEMDAHGLPGVKLKPVEDGTACQFMTDEGCSVYNDRPTACRYYPLGLMSIRKTDSSTDEQGYALVEEEHCLGHQEDRTLTVDEYRREQEVEDYDTLSRDWRQLILKKKSAGPSIGQPSEMSLQLFFMASYNLDQFQGFVTSDKFLMTYDLDGELVEKLKQDPLEVVKFGARFLKQVLFGEEFLPTRSGAEEQRQQHMKLRAEQLKNAAQFQAEAQANQAKETGS